MPWAFPDSTSSPGLTAALCCHGWMASLETIGPMSATELLPYFKSSHLRHVPTMDNPADCASRGMMPKELLSHVLWWEGPSWLQVEPVQVPWQPPRRLVSVPELRVAQCNLSVNVPPQWIEHNYSNFHFLIAVTGWCLRFVNRLKHRRPPDETLPAKHLTAKEIQQAENFLISMSQARSFAQDTQHLSKQQPISPSSRLRALNPFLDEAQLLRVGGRLSNSALSAAQRHPIILDSKDIMVTLMFNHMHVCLGHCGPSLLLCATGRRFHVAGARRLSRTVCSQCQVCRKIAAKAQPQQLADLPANRVTQNPAFATVGVDYAGPFLLKKGHTRKPVIVKSYLAVFVCFCTKAIHLEAVTDLTTEAFLACLKRFISRRGCPSTICSDNGSNFKGARSDLQELYRFLNSTSSTSAIAQYLLTQRIQWSMIPERSPHFGVFGRLL